MATYYVYSGATGGNTGADWANAFTSASSATAVSVFGDLILIDYRHSETLGSAITFNCDTISCEQDGTTGYFRRKATSPQITTTSSGTAGDIDYSGSNPDSSNFYGLFFVAGRISQIAFCNFVDCELHVADASITSGRFEMGIVNGSVIVMSDCTLDISGTGTNVSTSSKINLFTRSYTELNGCVIKTSNATFNTNRCLFDFLANDATLSVTNCDFTGMNFDQLCRSLGSGDSSRFINCTYPSLTTTLLDVSNPTGRHEFIGVTSGTDEFQTFVRDAFSNFSTDTGVTQTSSYSYLFDTNSQLTSKVGGVKHDIWHGRLDMSTSKTFTIEIAQDATTATLDNAQIWVVVVYRNSSNQLIRESQRALTLASVATHATSTATWSGLSGTNSRQRLSFSTTAAGATDTAVTVGIFIAEPNVSVNIEPDITVA